MRNVVTQRAFGRSGPRLVLVVTVAVMLLLAAASASFATTGNISGTVTNRSNGSPAAGATVAVGSQYTTTDSNGNYTLSNITSGNESVTISCSSYRTQTRVVTVPQNSTGTANFTLVPSNTEMTWYVAIAGNDQTGDGSASYPYATIDHADHLGVLSSGDIVHVYTGLITSTPTV